MSKPTPRAELYAWHARALELLKRNGVTNLRELAREVLPDEFPKVHESEPQCGFYLAHVRRFAAPVPARIFMRSEVDEEGELVSDEALVCELGGQAIDTFEAWPKLANRPISRAEFAYLMAVKTWAKQSAPDQPQAQTGRKIDWLTVKLPEVPNAKNKAHR